MSSPSSQPASAASPPIDAASADAALIDYEQVQRSPEFQQLRRSHRRFVFPLAIFFLSWYFAYVLVAAYAPGFYAISVIGNVNLGILLGLGQFVTTFVITSVYVAYANRRLDPAGQRIRESLERLEAGE